LETVTYAKKLGSDVAVVTNGNATPEQLATLGAYGANTILQDANIDGQDPSQLVKLVGAAAAKVGASNIIFSHDLIGKAVAPRLSVRLKAGLVAGAVALPQADGTTKVNVFSGKAFGFVKVNSAVRIISLLPNSIQPEQTGGNCSTEAFDSQAGSSAITVKATKKPEGAIPLPEAELVVSAGRGLKGPENWGMVEDLAAALGAATACSRPVSDIGWRPHHEHVGQTGIGCGQRDRQVATHKAELVKYVALVNQGHSVCHGHCQGHRVGCCRCNRGNQAGGICHGGSHGRCE
jgi:electron transfer flavoprotein alpha subunit